MAEDFLKHYQYNTNMAPNQTQLQNLTQKPNETFKEYAQRWRELAASVQPPLLKKELINMFIGNLQGPYFDKMVGSTCSGFSDIVLVSERIENMIKMRKIHNTASTSGVVKKPYIAYGKKREGEANETVVVRGRSPTYYAPYQTVVDVAPIQNQQPYTIPIDQRVVQQLGPYQ